ncbi:GNAT family N-acetyltransferase [Candidatus Nitrosotenuis chungbukensis]|uniref:GNAT family N-acetyltransferase n=1 Tax=Candidatus Nitrosotenuis chungbukensis TaxID=1353246 RepID=UPI002A4E2E12|nr:GNAT family N-acetyltransferase [Candidatus Nitrosotenuis chungbukensis]
MTRNFSTNYLKNEILKVLFRIKSLPTYHEHKQFVKSFPYSRWYVIYFNSVRAGSISITVQNEIGIWILQKFQNKGIGSKALEILIQKSPTKRYLANINPKNKESMEFFEKHNFKLIQYTFELKNNETKKKNKAI